MTNKTTITPPDTSLEASLLKVLSERQNYSQYISFVDFKRLLPNTSILLKDYAKYYELYPDDNFIRWDEFYTQFTQTWHKSDLTSHDVEYYRDYVFPAIQEKLSSNTQQVLLGLIEKEHLEHMSKLSTQGLDVSKLRNIIDTYEEKINKISCKVDKEVHTIDTVDFEVLDKTNGIPWFMPTLQNNLMSLSAGQFVVVSADSGTGKSAFVISQAAHSFRYLSKKGVTAPILYFNSEGTAADVWGRFLSNIYREKVAGGFEEIVERRKEIKEKFTSAFDKHLFKVLQVSDVPSFEQIKTKIDKYKPSLVIIDICDKLAPDEDPKSLKKLYDNLRVLSGATCPIIGTSQSGDTTYWDGDAKAVKARTWLNDHDLYGSITGKAGAADSLIMIGKDEHSSLRYISVTKQKRGQPVRIVAELQSIYSYYKEMTY